MTLRWNPFAIVTHNQVKAPRIVHHAVHVLLGLPCLLLPFPWSVIFALILAFYVKHVWLDWHRTSGEFFHPWVENETRLLDEIGDAILTVIGATLFWWLGHPLVLIPTYYAISLVNDP